jgi:hypothetical protein
MKLLVMQFSSTSCHFIPLCICINMFKLFSFALLVDLNRLNADLYVDSAVSVFYDKHIYVGKM